MKQNLTESLAQLTYGTAYALRGRRIKGLLPLWVRMARHAISPADPKTVPDACTALKNPDGLLGICSELTADNLRTAYSKGVFPFAHLGPQKWWAPQQRMVLFFEEARIEKNVRRLLRQNRFTVTFDRDFGAVIRGCAEPRAGRPLLTWITPPIIEAFTKLHEAGDAHSVEVWDKDGTLVGGIYGVVSGRVFFTESQFYRQRDASKVGFAVLNCHLQHWGFALNDCKHYSDHLNKQGLRLIDRQSFSKLMAQYAQRPGPDITWVVEDGLDVAAWKPAGQKANSRAAIEA